jgi:hypothetical protein
MAWQISEDVAAQKDGAVFLTWATSETIEVLGDPDDRRESARLLEAIPGRLSASHVCIPPEPMFRFLSSLILITLGREKRQAARVHSGRWIWCDCSQSRSSSGTFSNSLLFFFRLQECQRNLFIR